MNIKQEFNDWIEVKIDVNCRGLKFNFSEGEIW